MFLEMRLRQEHFPKFMASGGKSLLCRYVPLQFCFYVSFSNIISLTCKSVTTGLLHVVKLLSMYVIFMHFPPFIIKVIFIFSTVSEMFVLHVSSCQCSSNVHCYACRIEKSEMIQGRMDDVVIVLGSLISLVPLLVCEAMVEF
jgi:hypothetical protein